MEQQPVAAHCQQCGWHGAVFDLLDENKEVNMGFLMGLVGWLVDTDGSGHYDVVGPFDSCETAWAWAYKHWPELVDHNPKVPTFIKSRLMVDLVDPEDAVEQIAEYREEEDEDNE